MYKLFKIIIFTFLFLTTGCGLKEGYWPKSSYQQPSSGLIHGTVMTPKGMYMINGIRSNGMSSGSIIGPNGMTHYNFMH